MARDKGTVPYMDFGTVEVKIRDRNDNEPFFKTVSETKLGMVKNCDFTFSAQSTLNRFYTNLEDKIRSLMCIAFEGLTFFLLVSKNYGPFKLKENQVPYATVGKVYAEDQDVGKNAEITYSVVGENVALE